MESMFVTSFIPIEERVVLTPEDQMTIKSSKTNDAEQAPLAPWEQEKKEREILMEDQDLKNLLNNEKILGIKKIDRGYLIQTESYEVKATLACERFNFEKSEIMPMT